MALVVMLHIIIFLIIVFFEFLIISQTKDSTESRFRSGSNTSNRGARSGTDRYGGRGGSTQFSSSGMSFKHLIVGIYLSVLKVP